MYYNKVVYTIYIAVTLEYKHAVLSSSTPALCLHGGGDDWLLAN